MMQEALSSNAFALYSNKAKSLLIGMICEDPSERLNIVEVLGHPWFDTRKHTKSRNSQKDLGCQTPSPIPRPLSAEGPSSSPSKADITKITLPSLHGKSHSSNPEKHMSHPH